MSENPHVVELVKYILALVAGLAAIIKLIDAWFKAKTNKSVEVPEFSALKEKVALQEKDIENIKELCEKNEVKIDETKNYMTEKLLTLLTKYK